MAEIIPGLPNEIARQCLIRIPYHRLCTVAAVSKLWEEEVKSPVFHQLRNSSGLWHDIVVLTKVRPTIGPRDCRLALCEPATSRCDWLPPLLGFPDGIPRCCQVMSVGRNLVVVGGLKPASREASPAVFVYDFVAAKWWPGAVMPGPSRSYFACASDSDRTVFVAGGQDDERNNLKSALAYDVVRNEWVTLPDMETEMVVCKGIFHRGRFHVYGGYSRRHVQGERVKMFWQGAESFYVGKWEWGRTEKEEFDFSPCRRTCVIGDDGKLYRCRRGHVEVQEGAIWCLLAELPGNVSKRPYMVSWKGKLFVTGLGRHGEPNGLYRLDLGEGKDYRWKWVVDVGRVVALCCMEIYKT